MISWKPGLTARYVLTFGVLLFLANVLMGVVVLNQSKVAMRALINKDMLDVVNSAAGSLDGDALGALTEDDVDGPVFSEVKERLLVFQKSVDIHFIYAVKRVDKDHYVFTVDPDPVDPGEFGEEVLTTPALVAAADGVATVDEAAAEDRWGNFYSAYSPVFDSEGNVAGVVGVDFDAEWYDQQVQYYTFSIASVTVATLVLGGVAIAIVTNRVRMRLRELDNGMEVLSNDVGKLMDEMASYSGFEVPEGILDVPSEEAVDEMEKLSHMIHTMESEMSLYLEYLKVQAYTDALTQVGNSSAYHEAIHEADERIKAGTADFIVVAFDVNSLKELNDTFGHECGSAYIKAAAQAIVQGFDAQESVDAHTYRTGGDEFVTIAQGIDERRVRECLGKVDDAIAEFNATTPYDRKLSVSKAAARFVPGDDTSYKEVFARADRLMYEDKREFYRRTGERGEAQPRS